MSLVRPKAVLQRHPRWRLLLLLCLLGAMGVQQWAAQGHWHPLPQHGQAALEVPADPADRLPAHDCLWCHAAAHAGGAAPPPAWHPAILADTHCCVSRRFTISAHRFASTAWSWQSRGPPFA